MGVDRFVTGPLQNAGMRTTWVNREGTGIAGVEHREARSFDEVDPFLCSATG
jgi:FMN phosphatase YigB (HAD superfamily)